ncbi:unnamed protein product, partial [marine sediment metagenome]
YYCTNITITGGEYYNNSNGIYVYQSTYTNITDGDYHDNFMGIYSTDHSLYTNVTNCLTRNNSQHGIWFQGNSYSTITDCTVSNNVYYGIYMCPGDLANAVSSNITAINNTIYGSGSKGFFICRSPNSFLQNNIIYNNGWNFDVYGETIEEYYHNIGPSNTINGKLIYYIVETDDFILEGTSNVGYLALISSTNAILRNLDLPGVGVMLTNTTYSTFVNIKFYNSGIGLQLTRGSSHNSITNCVFYNNT